MWQECCTIPQCENESSLDLTIANLFKKSGTDHPNAKNVLRMAGLSLLL